VAIAVIAFIALRGGNPPKPVPTPTGASAAQIISQLTTIPASELDAVGGGTADKSKFAAITGRPALTESGKPEVLYLGAEYCPYCAAERWALIVALSRFGTLSGLDFMTSSSSDAFADTPTWTFRHATFAGSDIAFVGVEEADRAGNPLQQPTSAQAAIANQYGGGTIPFIDFGNRLYLNGANYFPQDLQGLSWQQIADALQQPTTSQAKEILGSANYLTAAICRAAGDGPAVCSDAVVKQLEAELPRS